MERMRILYRINFACKDRFGEWNFLNGEDSADCFLPNHFDMVMEGLACVEYDTQELFDGLDPPRETLERVKFGDEMFSWVFVRIDFETVSQEKPGRGKTYCYNGRRIFGGRSNCGSVG